MILKLPPLERTPTELAVYRARKMKLADECGLLHHGVGTGVSGGGGGGGVGGFAAVNAAGGVSRKEDTDEEFAEWISGFNSRLEKMVDEVQNETIGVCFGLCLLCSDLITLPPTPLQKRKPETDSIS